MSVEQIATRIHAEFREMPGLQLTLVQAQRLWGLEPSTCEAVVALLVAREVLRVKNGRIISM
jgi:hypothetical protein